MDSLIGNKLGPYEIVNWLGDGGMATVYKAYDPGTDRYVALKVLSTMLAADPDFQGRFDQEARVVAQLQHPHILPIYYYGKQDALSFIAMPLITSGTLADRLRGRPLALAETARIITQLSSALDYAHSKEIIHRDLKPSNVLIDENGNTFLTDFGIAKMVQSSARYTRTGGIIGTPSYMSPEQGMGHTLDGRSDVYSLGVILYECLTGKVPFEATTPVATVMQHVSEPLPSPKIYNPQITDAVVLVINKALAKQPADRFQTAGDLARALQMAMSNPQQTIAAFGGVAAATVIDSTPITPYGGSPPPPRPVEPQPERSGMPAWTWIIGLILVLLLAVGGGYILASALRADVPEETAEQPPQPPGTEPGDTGSGGPGEEVVDPGEVEDPGVVVVGDDTPIPEPPTDTPELPPPSDTPVPPTDTPIPPTDTPVPPTPTPEGPYGRIAFVSDRGGRDEIYLLDVRDPSNRRQLTQAPGSNGRDWWPSWCDQNNIVFERGDDPWQSDVQEITIVDINSGNSRNITSSSMPAGSKFNGIPSCSHDGRTLAFSTYSQQPAINWALGFVDREDSSPQFRTLGSDGYALAGNLSWSPDDRSVVFMHYDRDEKRYHIYRVDRDDPYDYTDISDDYAGNNKYPDWSPDGQWVVFSCGQTIGNDRTWSLCLTPSDYSRVEVILSDIHTGPERWQDIQLVRHAITPNWSPDSKWIAFSSSKDGDFDIYIYSIIDHELINLTNDWSSDEMHPSWDR